MKRLIPRQTLALVKKDWIIKKQSGKLWFLLDFIIPVYLCYTQITKNEP